MSPQASADTALQLQSEFAIVPVVDVSMIPDHSVTAHTGYDSSVNVSTKMPSSSSALSILFAYSPMIQIREAFASGSSSSSRFAHNVGMTPSYVEGYFRKMSYFLHEYQNSEATA